MIYLETNTKRLESFLKNIDNEFFPPISVQEKGIGKYAQKLIQKGKVIASTRGELDGILGYFLESKVLKADLLWIAPQRRNSRLIYQIIRRAINEEINFNGKIEAKTEETRTNMIGILKGLGFNLKEKIKADYIPKRTSLIFENDFRNLKKYFLQ